jgi:disulfide oxidoreductase YuzD
VRRIHANGFAYPVTVIDGDPVYEGSVSYPAILRAVQTRLASVS